LLGLNLGRRAVRNRRRALGLRDLLIAEVVGVLLVGGAWLLLVLRHLELELVLGGVLALVIEPVVVRLQRLGIPRPVAVVGTVLASLAAFVGLAVAFAIPLVAAGQHVVTDIPALVARLRAHRNTLEHLLFRFHLLGAVDVASQSIAKAAQLAVAPALGIASGALGAVESVVVVGTLALFLSLEAPKAIRWVLGALDPSRQAQVGGVLHDVAVAVAGYVLGNLATSLVAGLVVGLTYWALRLPYPGLIGLWVGLVDLLPLVGGLAGGLPAVALALVGGVRDALVVAAVVLAYQQLENHVLNPLVYARTVRLSPLWVLVAILIGAQAASLPGALIAIPIASALQVVLRETLREPLQRWLGGRSGSVFAEGADPPALGPDAGDEVLEGGEGHERGSGGARSVGVVEQERRPTVEPVGEVGQDGGGRGVGAPVTPPARPEHQP